MADEYDPNEFVIMKHPDIEVASQEVTRQAYEEVWKEKGWELADEAVEAGAQLKERPRGRSRAPREGEGADA